MVLKLYGVAYATCTQRVATVLLEKQVPFEFITVDLANREHKSPAYLEKQPFGQIPYIDDDGFILYESRAICRYIATKWAGKGTKLIPTDLKENALFEQAASNEQSNFDSSAAAAVYETVFKPYHGQTPDPAVFDALIKKLDAKLDVYDTILSKQKYVAGDELTLADLFHLPYGTMLATAGSNIMESKPNVDRRLAVDLLSPVGRSAFYDHDSSQRRTSMHAVLDDVILLRKLELEASLTNDNILSDAERSRGLDLLAEAQTALSSMNRQITLFQYSDAANIEAWISVRDEIEARVISMRIGLAPHKTLPSELISQIFLHCQGGNEVVKFPITKTKTPWVLGMVCRRWRIIACGDHALWKRISVDVDACRPGTIEFVEQIIRERGTSSLSLSLIMGWCNDASSSSNMAITMRLVPYFPRLQHLDLSLPTSLFLRLLDLPPEDFSSIESLKLTIIHNTANKSNNNITNDTGMFSNAPLLRRLELSTSHSPTLGIIRGLETQHHPSHPQGLPFPRKSLPSHPPLLA
ncbi:hypothetical protein C0991_010364 [Blastosporella zonata]|nr:hypothetical protein C0991_010364 [Blastosporella zonata]